ncbi:ribonuclease catalytic domain-containing protein [Breznakiella homolactica]|uniref:RNB domain-containing ribonuclease n=1 Tax=Breznakiella homolactica TaxID=2798577 RepID=A0A7T8BBP7_9SPIR|nr:RNB domain-containing ribonuclease [Breznakiella homolactica]QQO10802.1 RNB domain-containing ribonuclease [Breznakiella homolactica]
MVQEKSLAVYKNRPAVVLGGGDKIEILLPGGEKLKVRPKDIEIIHPGPAGSPDSYTGELPPGDIRGAWELLEGTEVPLAELADLVYGEFTPQSAWAAYSLLSEGLYFTGSPGAIRPRPAEAVAADEAKRAEKEREAGEREAFLARLKESKLILPDDRRFLQDAEALAYGKSDKSRTLRELGLAETPQEAHRLLLDSGAWTPFINPHPFRFGVSPGSAREPLADTPGEDRKDLTHLKAYAIDNEWSTDPDDAVSIEGNVLYVHVADPGSVILPESPADIEARGRGATLYLPEGTARMVAEEALPRFALGLTEVSPALTFKISLDSGGSVAEIEIFRSSVSVTRMTYAEADAAADNPDLTALTALAEANIRRRMAAGAVAIDFPEVHITVSGEHVTIEPIRQYRSADTVRECMLLAGEAAARWAVQNRVPFPYVIQETGELPAKPLAGPAGSYQLRRCMRARSLSVKPGLHGGLGLSGYSQVTSPLRRYTDLLAHQQIRAFLRGAPPIPDDELLVRLAAGEAAAGATVQAERASRQYWTAVYLMDKKGSTWTGIVLEKKGPRAAVMIPDLGLEIQAAIKTDAESNDTVSLTLGSVNLYQPETVFFSA